jgi:hypothetical protein
MKLQPVFERLIAGWRAQGHELVSLSSLRAGRYPSRLPGHRIEFGSVPGRSGQLALQGRRVAAPSTATALPADSRRP